MGSKHFTRSKKNHARSVQSQLKSRDVLALRARGMSYVDIADTLGISKSNAHIHVQHALADLREEILNEAENLVALELERLDNLWLSLYPQLSAVDEEGNAAPTLSAIDRALRIMERRAKLLGLDAPARTELTGAEGGPLKLYSTWTPDNWDENGDDDENS